MWNGDPNASKPDTLEQEPAKVKHEPVVPETAQQKADREAKARAAVKAALVVETPQQKADREAREAIEAKAAREKAEAEAKAKAEASRKIFGK